MSAKKEIWRLLEPVVDVWQEGDEIFDQGSWRLVGSNFGRELTGASFGRRRMTLPKPQGWISVKERMPTKEDGDSDGRVLWGWSSGGYRVDFYKNVSCAPDFWMPLPAFPAKSPEEEEYLQFRRRFHGNYPPEFDLELRTAYFEGKKSATTEKEGDV